MNDSESKLRNDILADAERRADRLVKRAERDVAKELDAVKKEHDNVAEQRLEEARKQAAEKRRAIAAGIDHDIMQRWLNRREERLDEVLREVLRELEEGARLDRRESLRQLLTEALQAIGPSTITVRANADCAARLDDEMLRTAAAAAWGDGRDHAVTVETDEALRPGLVAESADGSRRVDNTYATRMQRMHEYLRVLLGSAPTETQKHDATND